MLPTSLPGITNVTPGGFHVLKKPTTDFFLECGLQHAPPEEGEKHAIKGFAALGSRRVSDLRGFAVLHI